MRTPSSQKCRLDLAPPLADRFILGFPIDYGPVLLLMPFGFHLTVDTLPSEVRKQWLQVRLGSIQLSPSCPFRRLHTFRFLRPARHYPRFWIWRPSFERQRDFNPPVQRAAQHALRSSAPLIGASVLLASWGVHLCLFPLHHRPGSQVPYESPDKSHASYTPDPRMASK